MRRLFFILALLSGAVLNAEFFFTPQMVSSHLKGYSQEEIELLNKDLNVVRSVCLDGTKNTEERFYLATAGAPGARKTTILEKFVSLHPEYQGGVYLDPDPRTLKFMVHTYYARSLSPLVISSTGNYDKVIKNAYEKWRAGSNYIVLSLLEESFAAGRSITYGTTSTGAHTPDFFARLKENNYEIVLLLCSCPDEVRYKAVDYRNRVVRFYQSSPEDAVAKGALFSQRMDAYFTYADQLYFYWSDSVFAPEKLAGTWSKGKLDILDSKAMQQFVDKYETDRSALKEKGVMIPSFGAFLK
ncbi:MAG: hypothetical protein H0X51_00065 [Parachlamydiaceae bacterium]|nr:hypothetical protein [Parachlamydiaceae bacterium]